MTRDDIIRMAREAGSIDSEEVIETVWNAFSAAERDALRAELREATEATDDPAVNNLRTLPESIRILRAERDELLEALKLAVQQNDHDMLMTGEELRQARAAIAKATGETT